jgi:hypothetical protein
MKARLILSAATLTVAFSVAAHSASLPSAQTVNGITFLSGGIGHEEASVLKAEAKNYPLSLLFTAGPRHAFVSKVKVTIKDKAGKVVLDSTSDGPIMLVKLPAGEYRISRRCLAAAQGARRSPRRQAGGVPLAQGLTLLCE